MFIETNENNETKVLYYSNDYFKTASNDQLENSAVNYC